MNVFISWSEKDSPSHKLALFLENWLHNVIQSINTYVSTSKIHSGAIWVESIMNELKNSNFGIICLTKETMKSPWMHFESGAIYTSFERSHICPILLDLDPSELKGPLSIFQAVSSTKEDVLKLLTTINESQNSPLQDKQLKTSFELAWPALKAKIIELKEEIYKYSYLRELKSKSDEFAEFWSIFLRKIKIDENITAILSGKWGVEWMMGEPTTKPGHTALISYNEVNPLLNLQKKLKPVIDQFELIHGKVINRSTGKVIKHKYKISGRIIIIGSTHANSECVRYMEALQPPFEFKKGEIDKYIYYKDKEIIESYPSCDVKIDELKEDYGLIIRATNPYDRDRINKVLILAGNHGFGTESAIKFVADHERIKILNSIVGESDFAALFHAYVDEYEGDMVCLLKVLIKKEDSWKLEHEDIKP